MVMHFISMCVDGSMAVPVGRIQTRCCESSDDVCLAVEAEYSLPPKYSFGRDGYGCLRTGWVRYGGQTRVAVQGARGCDVPAYAWGQTVRAGCHRRCLPTTILSVGRICMLEFLMIYCYLMLADSHQGFAGARSFRHVKPPAPVSPRNGIAMFVPGSTEAGDSTAFAYFHQLTRHGLEARKLRPPQGRPLRVPIPP